MQGRPTGWQRPIPHRRRRCVQLARTRVRHRIRHRRRRSLEIRHRRRLGAPRPRDSEPLCFARPRGRRARAGTGLL